MDDFSDLRDDDFGFGDDDFSSDFSATDDSPQAFDEPDEFDQLRQTSARSETMYNDLDDEFDEGSGGSGFSLGQFSPGQKLILAILVVLNVLMIGFGLMVVLGVVGG